MDIQFVHNRRLEEVENTYEWQLRIASRGGETVAMQALEPWFIESLTPGDFFTKQVGFAVCSDEDNYCKKTGRELAKSRMKNMVFTVIGNQQFTVDRLVVLQDEKDRLYVIKKNAGAQKTWLVSCE
jgi:hypothetical protein